MTAVTQRPASTIIATWVLRKWLANQGDLLAAAGASWGGRTVRPQAAAWRGQDNASQGRQPMRQSERQEGVAHLQSMARHFVGRRGSGWLFAIVLTHRQLLKLPVSLAPNYLVGWQRLPAVSLVWRPKPRVSPTQLIFCTNEPDLVATGGHSFMLSAAVALSQSLTCLTRHAKSPIQQS